MKSVIIFAVLAFAAIVSAATMSKLNGFTTGRAAGNMSRWNGGQFGNHSTSQVARWNGFRPYSTAAGGGPTLAVVNTWKLESSSAATTGLTTLTGHGTAAGPTAGNLLVVGIGGGHQTTGWAIADTKSSTYTQVYTSIGGLTASALYYLKNIPAGITSLNCTATSSDSFVTCIIYEVSGASTTAPFTTGESGVQEQDSTTTPATPTINTATANSILFAFMANDDSNETWTLNYTGSKPASGWALYNTTYDQEPNGMTYLNASMPYIIVSSTQTAAKHVWSQTSSADNSCGVVAFH